MSDIVPQGNALWPIPISSRVDNKGNIKTFLSVTSIIKLSRTRHVGSPDYLGNKYCNSIVGC